MTFVDFISGYTLTKHFLERLKRARESELTQEYWKPTLLNYQDTAKVYELSSTESRDDMLILITPTAHSTYLKSSSHLS